MSEVPLTGRQEPGSRPLRVAANNVVGKFELDGACVAWNVSVAHISKKNVTK